MFWNTPATASTLPPRSAGTWLNFTSTMWTSPALEARAREHPVDERGRALGAVDADRLPAQVGRRADAARAGGDDRRQRGRHDGRDGGDRCVVLLGEEELGLVRHADVGPAGADERERVGDAGRRPRGDREPVSGEERPCPSPSRCRRGRGSAPSRGRASRACAATSSGAPDRRRTQRRGARGRGRRARALTLPLRAQGIASRSAAETAAKSASASPASTTTAAPTSGASSCAVAVCIVSPRPDEPPAYSAKRAATAAYDAATRAPEKTDGSAHGSSTRRKVAAREALRVRITRRYSGSTERRPSSAFTVTGKKQTSATITTLGASPKPR